MARTRRLKCSECPKAFPKLSDLEDHMNVHKSVKEHECKLCHKRFTRAPNVTRHMRRKHTIDIGTAPEDAADRPYVCATCGLGFQHARYLRAHKKVHDPVRKFRCPACRRFLSRKADLPRHQRTCLGTQGAGRGKTMIA